MFHSSFSNLVAYSVTAILVWITSLVIYRRFIHPLAKIPGPFWASITHFYIVRYNLFSGRSQFCFQVEKLHQEYGPVARISPDEIHLNDPDNYEKVYYIGSTAPPKTRYFYDAFGLKTAAFGTTNNALHRVRRAAINPVFSRKAVLQLEDVIQAKTQKLIHRIDELLSEGKPIDLHHGYRALAVDIVTDYSFDNCYNQLNTPHFAANFFNMTGELILRVWVLQALPILGPISNLVTMGIAKRMNTALYLFLQFRMVIYLASREVQEC
jgi:Cytochrome P450